MPGERIAVSVVSHRQSALVEPFLRELAALALPGLEARLTVNVPEPWAYDPCALGVPLRRFDNDSPRGFAANHNAAFRASPCDYFCVANPDIRLRGNPFAPLVEALRQPAAGVAAPIVLSPAGEIEDSARRFPTPAILLRKAFGAKEPAPAEPDWVAGMFMLFRAETYRAMGGFDEGFFMYYEDVELCARLRLAGRRVALVRAARVVHHAQRASHRNLRHAWWHAGSIARYFLSGTYARLRHAGALGNAP